MNIRYNKENSIAYFDNNYNLVMTNFDCQESQFILDDKNNTCRFCGKTKNEVTFSNKCHAIPELLGNKKIITNNECDICNHYYGDTIESDLGKFTSPLRTLDHIKGKNKIPKYRDVKNPRNTAEFLNGTLYVQNRNMLTVDQENKRLCFNLKTEKCIPINVYKSLVRIALNCMPKEYFDKFDNIKWLKSDETIELNKMYTNIFFKIIPNIPQMFNIFLFIRKNEVQNVPYCQMVLISNNLFFQVIIPFLNEDKILSDVVEIAECNFGLKDEKEHYTNIINLSSKKNTYISLAINTNYKKIENFK